MFKTPFQVYGSFTLLFMPLMYYKTLCGFKIYKKKFNTAPIFSSPVCFLCSIGIAT